MNLRKSAIWAVVIALLAVLAWKLHTSHFDWAGFWHDCRTADWRLLVLAALIIYSNSLVRAARWWFFLKPALPPAERPAWWTLIGSQFIGFAGLAALGRIGELIRPYLISKRTGLPFSSQVAVVAVERIFDLGAFGILFAGNLVFSKQLQHLPYHERYRLVGFAIAGAMVVLSLFVVGIRVSGAKIASALGRALSGASPKLGHAVEAKLLEFRAGLNVIGGFGDFLAISLLSLVLWGSVAVSYVFVMRAFASPVRDLTIAHTLLLMGFSVVGGLVQLPGIGGGAQALTIGALTRLFGIPAELAASAGMILWVVTTMAVLLPGVIFAQAEHVSLLGVAHESEEAEHHPAPAA
jgi:uncharacterized protein (TIRG00374 family)